MLLGYTYILCAAICWGLSATWARHLITTGAADALLISQTRVIFAWAVLACITAIGSRGSFKVNVRDLLRFAILGLAGIAGANYFLYRAIGEMNAALEDLIQFTAPLLVVLWMWLRREEKLDRPKMAALALSLVGCALALGVTGTGVNAPFPAVLSAAISAVCFATTLILGKHVSGRYSLLTYLNYSLLFASLFWMILTPPWKLAHRIDGTGPLLTLMVFSVCSILLPYLFFFNGLRRVPASRASIVSTFEPVVVAIGGWYFLHESLHASQVIGIVLVCAAIALIELTSAR
jgi:drug/metabolite transporter (DMT)-like permease